MPANEKKEDPEAQIATFLKANTFISSLNDKIQSFNSVSAPSSSQNFSLPALPLRELLKTIEANKKLQHDEFYEIIKHRYCVRFIVDKLKLFYLLDFEDQLFQSHMVLLLFKKARKYMLTAKIKVSYADFGGMKEHILEPQQLADYIEAETNEFDQLYSLFLKDVGSVAREEQADQDFLHNIDHPFDLEESHFLSMTKLAVEKIQGLSDQTALAVGNALLDIAVLENYILRVVDFKEKDKTFENYTNRLTNRELKELIDIKLSLIC